MAGVACLLLGVARANAQPLETVRVLVDARPPALAFRLNAEIAAAHFEAEPFGVRDSAGLQSMRTSDESLVRVLGPKMASILVQQSAGAALVTGPNCVHLWWRTLDGGLEHHDICASVESSIDVLAVQSVEAIRAVWLDLPKVTVDAPEPRVMVPTPPTLPARANHAPVLPIVVTTQDAGVDALRVPPNVVGYAAIGGGIVASGAGSNWTSTVGGQAGALWRNRLGVQVFAWSTPEPPRYSLASGTVECSTFAIGGSFVARQAFAQRRWAVQESVGIGRAWMQVHAIPKSGYQGASGRAESWTAVGELRLLWNVVPAAAIGAGIDATLLPEPIRVRAGTNNVAGWGPLWASAFLGAQIRLP